MQAFLEESEKKNIYNDARRVLETKNWGVAHDAEGKTEPELHQLYMICNKVDHPVKPPQSLYQILQQVTWEIESIEWRIQIERNCNHSVEAQRRIAIENIKVGSFSQHCLDFRDQECNGPMNLIPSCTSSFQLQKNWKSFELWGCEASARLLFS